MKFRLTYTDGQTTPEVNADVVTDADGRATIDVEICGTLEWSAISFAERVGIIVPGGGDLQSLVRLTTATSAGRPWSLNERATPRRGVVRAPFRNVRPEL